MQLVDGPTRMPDMMLLSGAKTWRFSPAIKDGEPRPLPDGPHLVGTAMTRQSICRDLQNEFTTVPDFRQSANGFPSCFVVHGSCTVTERISATWCVADSRMMSECS